MPDEIPAGVQPDEGQGAAGASEAPYAELLNRIPEELRSEVEPSLKEWDANWTRRSQEHAEYRKQWEPYETAGVNRYDPEAVQWGIQLYEAIQRDPAEVKTWLETEYGLTPAQAEQQIQDAAPTFDDPYGDPNAQLGQLLKPLEQKIESIVSWQQQQEEQGRLAAAQRQIDAEMAALEAAHPDEFKKTGPAGPKAMMEVLVGRYVGTDPPNAIKRAYKDYEAITAQIEQATLQAKVNDPPPAEGGGVANAAAEPVKWADTARIAMEQIRASNRAAG